MKNAMFKFSAALTLAAAAMSAAYAGGFMLTEQSVAGLGRAYAGSGIVGDDLSAVWYNPAGMVLLPGTQFQMGSVMAYLDLDVETNKGDTDNGAKHGVPIPNMFFTHQMNEDMWFGFGITVPFGMATEYKRDWELADHGMNAEVKVFDFNPNVAWKVNDKLSIGAGMSLQYVTAHFESGVPVGGATGYGRLSADGWAWGGNLGVMWQPTETLRFGLAYRSQVNHHADGTFKAGMKTGPDGIPKLGIPANTSGKGYNLGTYDGQATMSAPHVVTLTGTWEATQALRLSGLVRWTNWASFDSLPITSSAFGRLGQMAGNPTSSNTHKEEYHWKDSWLFTLGADYTINDAVTVRGGVGYEISPVDDDKYRSATIPDTDRLWLSLGATWHVNNKLQGDFGLAYLKGIGDKGLYNKTTGEQLGEFNKLDAILVGAQFVYRFD